MKIKSVQFNIEFRDPVELEDHGCNPLNQVYQALEALLKNGVIADLNMSSCEPVDEPSSVANEHLKSEVVRKWAKENGIECVDLKLLNLAELINDMFGGSR